MLPLTTHPDIIHIDFGFMLSNSPGSLGFESAPFKLTQEYVDVLGGQTSERFEEFRTLCKQAFQALRKSADNLVDLVGMMGKESRMPCFASGVTYSMTQMKGRFQLQLSEAEAEVFVDEQMINKSLGSYYTRGWWFWRPFLIYWRRMERWLTCALVYSVRCVPVPVSGDILSYLIRLTHRIYPSIHIFEQQIHLSPTPHKQPQENWREKTESRKLDTPDLHIFLTIYNLHRWRLYFPPSSASLSILPLTLLFGIYFYLLLFCNV